jgi:ornithine carbamoyltransferase
MSGPPDKDFLSLRDWPRERLAAVLELAAEVKARPQYFTRRLAGKSLAMVFAKASTRTRVSFEVGMYQLGGQALFLSCQDTQLGRGEPVEDAARVLSRYVDGVMIRTFAHEELERFAAAATVPVINGLTDRLHPIQVLSDLFTLQERCGEFTDLPVAWVGDGNNMANSWVIAAVVFGFPLTLACPPGYRPDDAIVAWAKEQAPGRIRFVDDPLKAVAGARVINTDVWASMGQEEEAAERRRVFASFQVNDALLGAAADDALVLHCLPAHRGEEITAQVFERFAEVIFTQAENRLHLQKALLIMLLGEES